MKKQRVFAGIMGLIVWLVVSAAAQDNQNEDAFTTQSLDGLWDFVVDLDPKYHQENKSYLMSKWDRRDWKKVEVPGVWNYYDNRLDIFEGVCWFARSFEVDPLPAGATVRLRFEGVNYLCQIFLNEQAVGCHEGGYTEFSFDITQKIKPGKNFLVVRVDNRATMMRLPPVLGYFNYGGIHRAVTLEIYPDAYLEDVFFSGVPEEGNGLLTVQGRVSGQAKDCSLRLECSGEKIRQELSSENHFELSLPLRDISPWSSQSPTLYPAKLQLFRNNRILHEKNHAVGFRRIEIRGREIFLNNRPVFLKGICYLYDSPVFGVTLHPTQYLEDLRLLKDMGVNTIRSHFPFNQAFYNECDRQGIMIWIEPPVYCLHPKTEETGTAFADPEFNRLAFAMVREMVLPARSHPSVLIYGIGNECNTENQEAIKFFRKIAQEIRKLDPTRLLSYASLYGQVGPAAELVDVIGINEYWGWYEKFDYGSKVTPRKNDPHGSADGQIEPIDLSALREKLDDLQGRYNKPFIITEFGADSKPGYISRSRDLWSENYHADLFRETFALFADFPQIQGTFPFCFCDYRDPSKYVNGYWDEINYKGVVSYKRRPKLAFEVLKYLYQRMENKQEKKNQ